MTNNKKVKTLSEISSYVPVYPVIAGTIILILAYIVGAFGLISIVNQNILRSPVEYGDAFYETDPRDIYLSKPVLNNQAEAISKWPDALFGTKTLPAVKRIETVLQHIYPDSNGAVISSALEELFCPKMKEYLLGLKSMNNRETFETLITNLTNTDPHWEKMLINAESSKIDYLKILLAEKMKVIRTEIRIGQKFIGPIQLLIFSFTAYILASLGFRLLALSTIKHAVQQIQTPDLLPEYYMELANAHFYKSIDRLVSLLPSLGFIGTIWGIGKALERFKDLADATKYSTTMEAVTQHLGYAFDTTLLALVMLILCEVCMAGILSVERREANKMFA